ncbi:MAG TPA: hypothetical protein VK527_06125 [Candidatus Limnocylindrales bacterium]|nr:hypothetical protein [Candidatus Limnocylindrales bacterium]
MPAAAMETYTQESPAVRHQLRTRTAALPLLLALVLLAGCSTSPLAPEQSGAPNQALSTGTTGSNLSLLPSTTLLVSKTVNGLLGGVITAGDWTVKIPAGAFLGIGTVTVRVPDPSVRKCELSIFPSLLNLFRVPVTLSCRLPNADAAGTYVMMWWDPATSTWKTIPSTSSATKLTCDAPLPHFSTYGCGKAGW